MNNADNGEIQIDLRQLFLYLKKRIWIVALSLIVFLLGGLFVSKVLIRPEYTAGTRIYILNRANEGSVAYSDVQLSSLFVNDYKELITGKNVTETVISGLGINDLTKEQLRKKISVSSPSNTRILQIEVTDSDPQRAADLANCVRMVAMEQISSIMDVDAVHLIYAADKPLAPSSPNVKRNTLLSGGIGAVLALGVLIAIFCLDDKIRTEEDVERYLGLGVLGSVPMGGKYADDEHTSKKGAHLKKQREMPMP